MANIDAIWTSIGTLCLDTFGNCLKKDSYSEITGVGHSGLAPKLKGVCLGLSSRFLHWATLHERRIWLLVNHRAYIAKQHSHSFSDVQTT